MLGQSYSISELLDLDLFERLLNHIWKTAAIPARLQVSQKILLCSPAKALDWSFLNPTCPDRSSENASGKLSTEIVKIGCLNQAWLPITIQGYQAAAIVIGEFLFSDQNPDETDIDELARLSGLTHTACAALLDDTPRIQPETCQNLIDRCCLQIDCITSTANHLLNRQSPPEAAEAAAKPAVTLKTSYRDIFSGLQAGILVESLDGEILDANDSACRIYGYTRDELLQLREKDLIPDEPSAIQPDLVTGIPIPLETLRLGKGGTPIPVGLSSHRLQMDGQNLVIVIAREISDRKKAEEQIRLAQERLELALDATDAGLWDWNILNGSLFISPKWYEMLGFQLNQIPQTHDAWMRMIHSEDISRVNYLIEQHLSGRRPVFEAEYRIPAQGGGWRWILSRGRAIEYASDGLPRRLIGTYMDISVRKAAEAAWRSSEEKFYKSFQISPDAISINRKEDAVYLDVNDGFTKMSGYKHEEIIGKTSTELKFWLYPDERRRMVDDLVLNGESIGLEASLRNKNGEITIGLVSARLIDIDNEACVLTIVRDITERKRSEDLLRNTYLRLEWAYEATLLGWNRALEMRDVATKRHSDRCIDLTLQLAEAAGIRGEELTFIKYGAILHDIGKLAIPDSILNKPAKLDRDEWALMRNHPLYAQELLQGIEYLQPALPLITNHHERWDGNGYPLGLKGNQIPLSARIFAIVDVWDSVIHPRVWRPALGEEAARQYIHESSGTHFDPELVKLFFALVGD